MCYCTAGLTSTVLNLGTSFLKTNFVLSLIGLSHAESVLSSILIVFAPVICNHSPQTPGGGQGIALEMRALTKVLPWQCGGNIRGLLYIGRKDREMKRKQAVGENSSGFYQRAVPTGLGY